MLESKRRAAIFLLLAFLLALAAGYLVFEKVKQLNSELGGMTKIYIANDSIQARTPIKENQITTEEIPNKFIKPNWHIVDKEDILNKVSIIPINDGEIIPETILKDFSIATDETKRLIAMYPSETVQFDQEVEPLDRVDIVVSTENSGQRKTEIFMRDVLVYFASKEDGNFLGAALEVGIDDAPRLIHMQHYADKIRILKASSGMSDTLTPSPSETVNEAERKKEEEKETETDTGEKPVANEEESS
ncbi:SAF domain-containing protein [Bacillus sp. B15-48]|uniref:SAF domain-containing protein n=1 Tax=Bacillus sp. B15-48 TaxID=1548601 RepID=UPI00193F4E67|nr:SAF domain-containing protein [Bacillus sp. B15-48]MBM4763241.1 flp pilus assembly protein CpaB [Bacillus sp. B15-48]